MCGYKKGVKMEELEILTLQKIYPKYNGKVANNFIDLSGQLYGNLLVLYRTENRKGTSRRNVPQWVCQCQCEKHSIVITTGVALRTGSTTGCGCTKGVRTKQIAPGTIFNNWKIIERVPNRGDNVVYYKCLCLECKETVSEVAYRHLKEGRSTRCLKCAAKKVGQNSTIDETGKTYGFLFVERKATEEEKPRKDKTGVYWNCSCLKCGKKNVIVFGDYLRNGDTKSCGCLRSYNEGRIAQLLSAANIKYSKQKTFKDLISEGKRACDQLLFDFAIYEKDRLSYLLEYDGIQHFEKGHLHNAYEKTSKNDSLKNKYCFENNIPLIRIPYDAEYTFDDLVLETTRFLLTPENEKEYYLTRSKAL